MFSWGESANTKCIDDVIILFMMVSNDKTLAMRLIVPKIEQFIHAVSDTKAFTLITSNPGIEEEDAIFHGHATVPQQVSDCRGC